MHHHCDAVYACYCADIYVRTYINMHMVTQVQKLIKHDTVLPCVYKVCNVNILHHHGDVCQHAYVVSPW